MERQQVICTQPLATFDDSYHVDIKQARTNNCLFSHPYYSGKEKRDCVYVIPQIGEFVVPGLGESVFESPVKPLFLPNGRPTPYKAVRLPGIHVLLNQAQKAALGDVEYDWGLFRFHLQQETLSLLGQVIDRRAMRSHEYDGFMALAQASPNQPLNTLVIGTEMAREILPLARSLNPGIRSINDLNGRAIVCCIRFPATRSSGVKLRMILRVAGRGRCVYVHPIVLKEHFLGDVDGDILYIAFDPHMRCLPYDPEISVEPPTVVTKHRFWGDSSLSDCVFHPFDKEDIYRGLVSKEGIGQITNAFYRSICVAHKEYQWTPESRLEFLHKCGRQELLDLMKETTEDESRARFRWLSAVALMDAFAPWYEACFDARKDTSNLVHIHHFLGALRDPDNYPIDKDTFKDFHWDGQAVDMRPILAVWDACGTRLTAYVDDLTVQALFFDGKGDSQRRKERLARILALHGDAPAARIWSELNNITMTFIDEEESGD